MPGWANYFLRSGCGNQSIATEIENKIFTRWKNPLTITSCFAWSGLREQSSVTIKDEISTLTCVAARPYLTKFSNLQFKSADTLTFSFGFNVFSHSGSTMVRTRGWGRPNSNLLVYGNAAFLTTTSLTMIFTTLF